MRLSDGHVIGTISAVALSFIVHEPSGIMVDEGEVLVGELEDVAQHLV